MNLINPFNIPKTANVNYKNRGTKGHELKRQTNIFCDNVSLFGPIFNS